MRADKVAPAVGAPMGSQRGTSTIRASSRAALLALLVALVPFAVSCQGGVWTSQDFPSPGIRRGLDQRTWPYRLRVYESHSGPQDAISRRNVHVTVHAKDGTSLLDDRLDYKCAAIDWKVVWERFDTIHIELVEIGDTDREGNAHNRSLLEWGPRSLARLTYRFDRDARKFVRESAAETAAGSTAFWSGDIRARRFSYPETWPLAASQTPKAVQRRIDDRQSMVLLLVDSRQYYDIGRNLVLEGIREYGHRVELVEFDLANYPPVGGRETTGQPGADAARVEAMARELGVTFTPWVAVLDRRGRIVWRSSETWINDDRVRLEVERASQAD